MRLSTPLFHALLPLLPLSLLSLAYLYLYPVFRGCAFASPHPSRADAPSTASAWYLGPFGHQQQAANAAAHIPTVAPFRLLALGDPQLEGDSALPKITEDGKGMFRSFSKLWTSPLREWNTGALWQALHGMILKDIPKLIKYGRKSLDLWGNDLYLAHIYRKVHAWTDPTHVVVLGDLLGSQWVSDEEFERRSDRFWDRVFKEGQRVADSVMGVRATEADPAEFTLEVSQDLGADEAWSKRIIAISGNHDIGYAGDIDENRVDRFEKRFGKVNWSIRFTLPTDAQNSVTNESLSAPALRLIILNSMNLDAPAKAAELQSQTYDFLNDAILSQTPLREGPTFDDTATILLTHIPLHKRDGICADGPFFNYFSEEYGSGVKEQNHLSERVSEQGVLEGLFGMKGHGRQELSNQGFGRNGIILTGHDHVGCDTWHYWDDAAMQDENSSSESANGRWDAAAYKSAAAQQLRLEHEELVRSPDTSQDRQATPGIREITVRSMMGEFDGNAGFLSAWFDQDIQQWRFEYASCSLGVQHIWWAAHILTLVTCGIAAAAFTAAALESKPPVQPQVTLSKPEPVVPKSEMQKDTMPVEGTARHDSTMPRILVEERPEDDRFRLMTPKHDTFEQDALEQDVPKGQKIVEDARGTEPLPSPEKLSTDSPSQSTPSLTRSESKRLASDIMKQRREKFQRSLRSKSTGPEDGSPGLFRRVSSRRSADPEWEIVSPDLPG